MPGDASHDFQHLRIGDVTIAELLLNHPSSGFHETRFLRRLSWAILLRWHSALRPKKPQAKRHATDR
jgi:hypothetical protein